MTNKFDSDFERIEKAFRKQAEMKARLEAKSLALARAMEGFEQEEIEKNSDATQGIGDGARLSQQVGGKPTLFDWRQKMKTINSKFAYSLMGGASIAVLAMVVVAPNMINEIGLPNFSADQKEIMQVSPEVADQQSAGVRQEADSIIAEPAPAASPAAKPKTSSELSIAPANQPQTMQLNDQVAGVIAKSSKAFSRTQQIEVLPRVYEGQSRDKFENVSQNPIKRVSEEPVSTFSADVDTASYSFMRSSLNNNVLPPADSIRVEELINYFDYDYALPQDKSEPFKANVEIMPTPWNEGTKLMSIGIKGYEFERTEQPSSNLVFLIDTSGSMSAANKLPLLRNSFKLLLNTLKPSDTVSIVTYAGSAGIALEPTKASDRSKIMSALDNLNAGGSTAGAAGIRQAYSLAEQNLEKDGINRVILATDGDFNVGISDPEQLKSYVERKRKTGVTLSVLGFGRGNYNDQLMQKLAQNGNGNASYIDTLSEARKVLVEEVGSTLFTIAKDVKLQVEFNPSLVSEYRLIGYETRALNREDFNNDKVDAGDIGAGHTVTALYEFTPVDSGSQSVDPLRYQAEQTEVGKPVTSNPNEYGFLKIRYKLPDSEKSSLITTPVTKSNEVSAVTSASENTRFAASVAAFGQLLKGSSYLGDYTYDDVIKLSQTAKGSDPFGYRSEFINLVRSAETIDNLR